MTNMTTLRTTPPLLPASIQPSKHIPDGQTYQNMPKPHDVRQRTPILILHPPIMLIKATQRGDQTFMFFLPYVLYVRGISFTIYNVLYTHKSWCPNRTTLEQHITVKHVDL